MPRNVEPLERRLLLSDGTLDSSFGTGGIVTFGDGGNDVVRGFIQEPDGQFLIAATDKPSGDTIAELGMAQLNPDGSMDTTFGGGTGVETLNFNGFQARSLQLEPNGQILVGGTNGGELAVVRLNSDGSPDATFGNDGQAMVSVAGASGVQNMLVLYDGDIVGVGGDALIAFNNSGQLDPGFGTGGVVTLGFGPLKCLALASNGDIYAGGADNGGGVIAEFTETGQFVPSFFAFTSFSPDSQNGIFTDMVVLTNGQIVASGDAQEPGSAQTDMVVVRFESDGTADPTFGNGGVAIESFAGAGGADQINAVAVQPDGRVIACGQSYTPPVLLGPATHTQFILFRLDSDGTLDTTFGSNGSVTQTFPGLTGLNAKALGMVLEPDGTIVVAGSGGGDYAVAQYLGAFANLVGQEVYVNGTNGPDTILVDLSGSYIDATLDGRVETFVADSVTRIQIFGAAGNDSITIDPGLPRTEARGGKGGDTILGGDGPDTLIGGGANDSLTGQGTTGDSLRGGGANDTLVASPNGNSTLNSGVGDDSLVGGPGDDIFYLHEQYDSASVVGDGGNDTAYYVDSYTDTLVGIDSISD